MFRFVFVFRVLGGISTLLPLLLLLLWRRRRRAVTAAVAAAGGGGREEEVSLSVIMTNTEIFHIYHINSCAPFQLFGSRD